MASTTAVLTDLIQQRDKLNRAIAALQALDGVQPPAPPKVLAVRKVEAEPVKRRRRTRNRRPAGTFPKAVLSYLNDRSEPQTAKHITDMLPAYGVNGKKSSRRMGVEYALRSLQAKGKVMQTSEGWSAIRFEPAQQHTV